MEEGSISVSLSKTDAAYSYIKNKIITGELPPRADVSEEALQAELKMLIIILKDMNLLHRVLLLSLVLNQAFFKKNIDFISLSLFLL